MTALFEYELILYDEVKNFKDYTSPLFYYPFQVNKNVITSLNLDTNDTVDNYKYSHTDIYF